MSATFALVTGASLLITLAALVAMGAVVKDINSLYDEVMVEMDEFRVGCHHFISSSAFKSISLLNIYIIYIIYMPWFYNVLRSHAK